MLNISSNTAEKGKTLLSLNDKELLNKIGLAKRKEKLKTNPLLYFREEILKATRGVFPLSKKSNDGNVLINFRSAIGFANMCPSQNKITIEFYENEEFKIKEEDKEEIKQGFIELENRIKKEVVEANQNLSTLFTQVEVDNRIKEFYSY